MSAIVDITMIAIRTAKDLGAFIRERRREAKLDQRTLAQQVGVSRQWIIEIERGKARAAVGLVLRTLEVLGVRLTMTMENVLEPKASAIDAVVARAKGKRT